MSTKEVSQFRKKPVVIEAIQYTGYNHHLISQWSKGACVESPVLEPDDDNPTGAYTQIKTLEGVMTAGVGDWIIKGVKGEFYPCKPDIFEATYEPLGQPSNEVKTKEEIAKKHIAILDGYVYTGSPISPHKIYAAMEEYASQSVRIALEGQKGSVDESIPPSSKGDEDKLVKAALKEFIAAMPTSGTIIANSLHPLWTAVEHAQAAIQSYEQSQKVG